MLEGHAKRIYRVKTGDRMQVFDLSVKEPEMIEFTLLDKRAQDEPPDYERLFESTAQKDLIGSDALMALAEAMIDLARNRERRAELGANARRGAGELTVDAVAARLTRTYQVLSGPKVQPSAPVVGTN